MVRELPKGLYGLVSENLAYPDFKKYFKHKLAGILKRLLYEFAARRPKFIGTFGCLA